MIGQQLGSTIFESKQQLGDDPKAYKGDSPVELDFEGKFK